MAHVLNLAPEFIVNVGKVRCFVFILEHQCEVRHARSRNRLFDPFELGHQLDGVFDVVGHLILYLLRGSSGIQRDDLGRFDGKVRIFQLSHPVETVDTAADHQYHQQPRDDLTLD